MSYYEDSLTAVNTSPLSLEEECRLFNEFYKLPPYGVLVRIRNHRPQLERLYYMPTGAVPRPGEVEALEAREKLMRSFFLLVIGCAKRFSRGMLTPEEAVSHGNRIMLELLERRLFRCGEQSRFSSLLFKYLRGKIWNECRILRRYRGTFSSFEEQLSGGDTLSHGEPGAMIDPYPRPGEEFEREDLKRFRREYQKKTFKRLSARKRQLLKLRLVDELPFEEVGKRLKITRQGAQQSFNTLCQKLRDQIEKNPRLLREIKYEKNEK